MRNSFHRALVALSAFLLGACAPNHSPNTYSSNAVQLANKVEAGTIIGYREVKISANGSIGTVTGGAVGGILGAEYANSALIAVGGTTVGGILGNALEHAARDTPGWEYIVRKDNGDMLSVTQREAVPLPLAQRVLVIMGPQARVVADYSLLREPRPSAAAPEEKKEAKSEPVKVEVVLSLSPGVSVQPKTEGVRAAATDNEPAAQRQAPLEERLLDAVLAESLADQPTYAPTLDSAADATASDRPPAGVH